MPLVIYDTMSRRKVPLVPRTPGEASMYVCGPTVYDVPHLGHGRTALTYDVIARYLEWSGFRVRLVSNITDVDDKIIARARAEGRSETEVAAEFTDAYDVEMGRLGIRLPDARPRATQFVPQMIELIAQLVETGMAYVVEGQGVYFSVRDLPDYGCLAHRTLDQLRTDAGSRVDVDPRKRSPLDFALWKSTDDDGLAWETPWGRGRPGWHTECVAMSLRELGEGFDLHGGGDDLVFPHHQNEWAQAHALRKAFARCWVHSAMVNVGSEKMAKSAGNFTNLSEAVDAAGARAVRLLALQTHYRKPMEMGPEALAAAAGGVERLDALWRRCVSVGLDTAAPEPTVAEAARPPTQSQMRAAGPTRYDCAAVDAFSDAMDDDFATPTAVQVAFTLVRRANALLDGRLASASPAPSDTTGGLHETEELEVCVRTAHALFGVLGVAIDAADGRRAASASGPTDEQIESLLAERARARHAKDFARADAIRDELSDHGVVLEDGPSGTRWHRSAASS